MTFRYQAGLHSVGSYQVSGVPWVTGSGENGLAAGDEHRIDFPSVAKSVTVINVDPGATATLRVHFNSKDAAGNVIAGNHFVPLGLEYQSLEVQMKCTEIFISAPAAGTACSYVVLASLTGIDKTQMFPLTGSGLTD